MLRRSHNLRAGFLIGMLLALTLATATYAQQKSPPTGTDETMNKQAKGTFEVKLSPQQDNAAEPLLGRMTIEKRWLGDLAGTSTGQMLTGGDPAKGSAGYVAMEKVTATLQGKKGSFILQHSGTMERGENQLTISVVPDSGTGELEGLTGMMMIKIENGKHYYEFEYRIKCACE